ncbi:endonuclease/exonuclease/phosphatase family protein [Streptomyces sp. MUM 203J]|uniref:endonuclease/exonuclease/phosphatase family protein n=1 Tax=Streptomyces sp. MUM 203J TaxID=2791990 RepID=UPI001F03B648|nr:endonuclease/exonuclease/phosphatase family protein [Streptomyces sp. MUM 203J]MCH0539599.1 endonuclease/exonuclease/phosphatase family protein [Streptomyces sp. MUM 203J]
MASSLPRTAAVSAVVASALAAGLLAGASTSAAETGGDTAYGAATTRIHDIQGVTRISPLVGRQVTDVPGIVTGVRTYGSKGFWFQDAEGDGDAATSEGLFVYTGSAPTVSAGDAVTVSGRITEYVPGGLNSGNQSLTQISKPTVTVVSSGNDVPAPVVITDSDVPAAYTPEGDPADGGSVNKLPLQPSSYALDYYESLEGMNTRIGDVRIVGPSTRYAELWVTVKPGENPTPRGGTVYGAYDAQNGGRLKVQSLIPLKEEPFPAANVGDMLTGGAEGPLDFNQYGGYTLVSRTSLTVEDRGLRPERTRRQHWKELAVATYNVENLDPGDPQEQFDALAKGIVDNLASPDIVALEEIQDNSGPTKDGTVAADETLKKFTDAIVAAGGPAYEWRGIDPEDLKDGGQPGGNIRQVFLFNPERVAFFDRKGGDATTATGVVKRYGKASLTLSPGRIDPANAAWENSRKPLAGEFYFRGKPVIVIANHFGSKGGDESIVSHRQPPNRSSEVERHQQAKTVNSFVKDILAVQKNAKVVVLGDINDFEFSDTTRLLTDGGVLHPAITSLPAAERYSYVYQGNSQVLDQILTSPGIRRFEYDSVHINAEFADQHSDHDPQILRFRP